jgi:hypothetical protein
VAHACNPSYLGEKDQDDCGSRLVQKKKVRETPISNSKLAKLVHTCNPTYAGGIGKRSALDKSIRPYLKNSLK